MKKKFSLNKLKIIVVRLVSIEDLHLKYSILDIDNRASIKLYLIMGLDLI